MSAPHTANGIAAQLGQLARDLDETVRILNTSDKDAVEKRHAHSVALSRAFLAADGSVEYRRHTAVVQTERQSIEAEVAEQVVRHLRRTVDSIKTRIDVGRSISSAMKAELSLVQSGVGT